MAMKALDFRYFSVPDSFEQVEWVIVCGNLSKDKSAQKVSELSCHDRCQRHHFCKLLLVHLGKSLKNANLIFDEN